MIMVDVYVPSVDREYDFEIDENAPISLVIEEISAMVCQKEQCVLSGAVQELMLCDRETQRILTPGKNLRECGVGVGAKLILV